MVYSSDSTVITQKKQCGGARHWALHHLDNKDETAHRFTMEVIPKARELAGTLPPWKNPSSAQIQDIVNEVFGEGAYEVTSDGPWMGLVCNFCSRVSSHLWNR